MVFSFFNNPGGKVTFGGPSASKPDEKADEEGNKMGGLFSSQRKQPAIQIWTQEGQVVELSTCQGPVTWEGSDDGFGRGYYMPYVGMIPKRKSELMYTLHKDGKVIKFRDQAGMLTMVGSIVDAELEEGEVAVASNFGFGNADQYFSFEEAEQLYKTIKQGVNIMQRIDCIMDDDVLV